ncbi:leucine-rich repeat protein [uncultured Rikenella sp.]|uniref:leucine-rich repeat protein n=1 Tax=uncultured Rikenella sp. TaxID=368003 RepID=UPI0026161A0B|nr:leucine-rich repeat protein [uncultured Rikenella sp.]
MKKLLIFLLSGTLLFGCSKYDDSELRNWLNNLSYRVSILEDQLSTLHTIVTALQKQVTITKLKENKNGYTIYFSDGQSATIRNGMNSGDAPDIGVKQDKDGLYYWTVNGTWLTDDAGKKISVQGETGDNVIPQLKITNGYWYISYDKGNSWTQLGKAVGEDGADGADGKNGDSVFKSVTEDKDNVYFTLMNGTVLTIPKNEESKFTIVFSTTDAAILNGDESKTISYTIKGGTENTVVKTIAQDGWKTVVNPTSPSEGTITVTAPSPIVESEILVFVNDGEYRTLMASLNCMQGQIVMADNAIDVTFQGGTVAIKLKTNMDYTVEIPADAQSWLSLIPGTRALQEQTLSFQIAANYGPQRFTTVTLTDELKNTLQTIIIQQLGAFSGEIHVRQTGTLESILSNYDYTRIESLKITGILGLKDFLFLKQKMPKLTDLDISEVNIHALSAEALKATKIKKILLPNNLTTIDDYTFQNCYQLASIKIPTSVETIGKAAFKGCSRLESVTFESGSQLKTIGGGYNELRFDGAFAKCTSLTSIEIPASVETIESTAFWGCSSLESVTFEPESQLKIIGGGGYPSSMSSAALVEYHGAFAKCTSLTSIEIPASVETIGESAFWGCSKLKSVTFKPDSHLKIIDGSYCYTSIAPGSSTSATKLSYGAFTACTSLTSIEIPASVETIGAAAFLCCSRLESVTFEPESQLKTIGGGYTNRILGQGAFTACTSLTLIEIPASVETIGDAAFWQCSNLKSVTFEPESQLKTIGGREYIGFRGGFGAFAELDNLTTVDMSNCTAVKELGAYAFYNCPLLRVFKIGTLTPPKVGKEGFSGINSYWRLQVPSEAIAAYGAANGWSSRNITGLDE